MQELTKSQKGRIAIRTFKAAADALVLRGHYKPSGRSGQTLENALREIGPEIYGTMNDPRIIELNGLEYVLDRIPRGIEECHRIILTAQEDLHETTFEMIEPLKRRRLSYRMGTSEICFVITRGVSEVYDLLTHLSFLNIEAKKIYARVHDRNSEMAILWEQLGDIVKNRSELKGEELDQAIWNLSILLGRTYLETRKTYDSLEKNRIEKNSNNGLFHIVYHLGQRVAEEKESEEKELVIFFTPTFRDMNGQHAVSRQWARSVKDKLAELNLKDRPFHIISANMHSVKNTLYGYGALQKKISEKEETDFYQLIDLARTSNDVVTEYSHNNGMFDMTDSSGANIDFQIIDTAQFPTLKAHPDLKLNEETIRKKKPVILVMDYAFGEQAFELMDELLNPPEGDSHYHPNRIQSISIVGKAGILTGNKGDIMLAKAHVLEGTANNYQVENDLKPEDFEKTIDVYEGPMVTVLGTSLQNRHVLEKFQTTSWKAIGLEMEGGHYHRAISAAIIKGHITQNVKTRYAYYASDNPLHSGQTLASGSMGKEGIRPTYLITKVILEKILQG